jgi:hypothetical protein
MFRKGSVPILMIIFLLFWATVFVLFQTKVLTLKDLTFNKMPPEVPTVTPSVTLVPSPTLSLATSSATPSQSVPLSTQEDVIRLFFQLINDQKASEAVAMLSKSAAPDDSTRQMWGVNFNSIKEVKIKSIEKVNIADLQTENEYQVTFDIKVKASGNQYGWQDGQDTRFIPLVKENGVWKIEGIATGP